MASRKELIIRSIKLVDIGYIYALLGIVGSVSGLGLNTLYGPPQDGSKSSWLVILEVLGILLLNGSILYLLLNICEYIPSPFQGLYGYDHIRTYKGYAQVILALTLFLFQDSLIIKIRGLKDKIINQNMNQQMVQNQPINPQLNPNPFIVENKNPNLPMNPNPPIQNQNPNPPMNPNLPIQNQNPNPPMNPNLPIQNPNLNLSMNSAQPQPTVGMKNAQMNQPQNRPRPPQGPQGIITPIPNVGQA